MPNRLATVSEGLSDSQAAALREVCISVAPSLEHDPDPDGLWAWGADKGPTIQAVQESIEAIPDPIARGGLTELLDAFAAQGLGDAPTQQAREAILTAVAASSPEAAAGVGALVGLTLFMHYGLPDPRSSTAASRRWRPTR